MSGLYVDLAASRGEQKIAVEIKTFGSTSAVQDRTLYLAVPELAFQTIFAERLGQMALRKRLSHILVYRIEPPEIIQWIPES